jgi:hypothetical protein
MNREILPKGIAVHTRDIERGKDYGWYVRKGDLWLFKPIEDIYRVALRDTSGETRKLALLNAEKRVGIMLCDMPSERIDHGNRIIYDTLYAEFEEVSRADILEYASALLVCAAEEYENIRGYATEYAEKLYQEPESELEKYSFSSPDTPVTETTSKAKLSGKRILPSLPENFQRCSAYLKSAVIQKNASFVFISTGRVGMERCRQVADKYDQCLILTMSSEIKSEVNLKDIFSALNSLFERGKRYIENL